MLLDDSNARFDLCRAIFEATESLRTCVFVSVSICTNESLETNRTAGIVFLLENLSCVI